MQQIIPPFTAIELIRRFREQRVLVIGDAMLDTYLEGEATRLCTEGPVPVLRKTTEQRIPGGAANTVSNLRSLEARVDFLSVVGRDSAASALRLALLDRGISDRWLVEDETTSTIHKLRVLANGQYVIRFDEGVLLDRPASPYTPSCQQLLLARLDELYTRCNIVVISDYGYGVVSDELIARLCTLHAAHPKMILVDSKALRRFHHLPMTVITPNLQEARLLVQEPIGSEHTDESNGHYDRNSDRFSSQPNAVPESATMLSPRPLSSDKLADVEQIARHLLALFPAEHVAITLAEHGVFLLDRHEQMLHIPASQVQPVSDVGAGDTFTATLALALAAGGVIEEAARIAIDAAGISVTKQNTATVQYQELIQRVSLRLYTSQVHADTTQSALDRLSAQLEIERILGHTIVFTNGIFDILHVGHVQFLRQARALGDVLVVAVNSDSSARRKKGRGRPINSERDRLALVAALDMVDYALLFDEDTPITLIQTLRPHIHVKGGDYANETLPEAAAVNAVGGRLIILPLLGSVSTSNVIERIVETVLKK